MAKAETWRIKFDKNKNLGRGTFGIVYEGEYKKEVVAVKRILLDNIVDEREEHALKRLSHANVLKLFHVEDQGEFRYL